MKITNVKVIHDNIPLEAPSLRTSGYYHGTSKAIIEIEIDKGLNGLSSVFL